MRLHLSPVMLHLPKWRDTPERPTGSVSPVPQCESLSRANHEQEIGKPWYPVSHKLWKAQEIQREPNESYEPKRFPTSRLCQPNCSRRHRVEKPRTRASTSAGSVRPNASCLASYVALLAVAA